MTPRVALFADTFTEVNGAANVLRKLTEYARESDFPFLCIHSGDQPAIVEAGSLTCLQYKRNHFSFTLDSELKYDPFFWRYYRRIARALKEFKPDVLHITGPSDVSQIGLAYAHFNNLPLIASWHTNAHEYAVKRASGMLQWLPENTRIKTENVIENIALKSLMKFLFPAQIQLAPNEELVELLRKMTKRPSFLMSRGVDTVLFSPDKRKRTDEIFTLGYVGRLRPEKNIRLLGEVDRELRNRGVSKYRWLIVGDGSEEDWLKENLSSATFTGVLRDAELATAYANIDFFLFPSKTDAFGNVVLEAAASGVPSVVLPDNGPRFLIDQNVSGYISQDERDFIRFAADFTENHPNLKEMSVAARNRALEYSWKKVFDNVYEYYEMAKTIDKKVRA